MSGPYRNETEACVEPMPRAVAELFAAGRVRSGDPEQVVGDTILRHVDAACENAGVELGEFDRRKLSWLADVDTAVVQVVIGLITRAHEAGRVVRA